MTSTSWGHAVAELAVEDDSCRVHAEGWQSWTPTTSYRVGQSQWLPVRPQLWQQSYGGSRPRPPDGVLQGDGLIVVDPGTGADVIWVGARGAAQEIPVVRCERVGPGRLELRADGPVAVGAAPAEQGVAGAKAAFADQFAQASGVGPPRAAPTIWCSWYQYFTEVTEADMDENLAAIAERELPVDVVQLDDGYQREIGDWLLLSERFSSLPAMVDRIRATGRRAGIWLAPFLVGANSVLAAEHPDWLVGTDDGAPLVAQTGWGQRIHVLDPTHPGARDHLRQVLDHFLAIGIDFFKLDFVFAAALDGRRHDRHCGSVQAYRSGMAHIKSTVDGAYLLGCGAPLLPSVGLVDAMRVSADTAPHWTAMEADLSLPGGESVELTVPARAYQHGRFWVNDPDCLLLRPEVDHRERRAELIGRHGGLRGSSDRIAALDDWGLAETTRLLGGVPPPTPFDS